MPEESSGIQANKSWNETEHESFDTSILELKLFKDHDREHSLPKRGKPSA